MDERTSAHGDSSVSKYVKGRPDEKPNWPGDGDCDVGEAAVTDISGGAREPCVATAVGIDSSSSGESPPSSSFSDGEDVSAPSATRPTSGKSSGGGAGARDDGGSLTTRTIDRGDDGADGFFAVLLGFAVHSKYTLVSTKLKTRTDDIIVIRKGLQRWYLDGSSDHSGDFDGFQRQRHFGDFLASCSVF